MVLTNMHSPAFIQFEITEVLLIAARSFNLKDSKIREIKYLILRFYENNINSKVTPKVLIVCILDHFKDKGEFSKTRKEISRAFGITSENISRKKKEYLEMMDIKPFLPPSQMTSITRGEIYQWHH